MRTFALLMMAGGTALVTLHGCGLSVVGYDQAAAVDGGVSPGPAGESGTDDDDATGSIGDGSVTDGPSLTDGSPDRETGDGDAGPDASDCHCTVSVPPGWTLVGYAPSRDAPCPTGFAAADRVTSPVAASDACTCGCTLGTLPSCNKGNFSSVDDTSATALCNGAGTSRPTNDGQCTNASNILKNHRRAVPPPPDATPATCTAPSVAHPDRVTTTNVRACEPTGGHCACDPALGPAFAVCVRSPGAVTCPSGFTQRTVVGTAGALSCGASCGCTVTNLSCSGTITYYSAQNCPAGSVIEVIDDKTCSEEKASSFSSYKWTGTTNATCSPGAAPTPTVSLDGSETVCCP